MDIGQWLGGRTDPQLKELLSLLLAEWMSHINQVRDMDNSGKGEDEVKTMEEWEKRVKEACPELAQENREFLEWMVECQGEALEDYYFYGLVDGARAMKWLMKKLEG